MTKLKLLRLYRTEDVPDHLLQEISDLCAKMVTAIGKVSKGHDSNMILSAYNRVHAAIICEIVAESSIKDAAQTEAIALVRNIEHLSGQDVFTSKNDD